MVLWVWLKLVNFKLWTCHVWWTIHVHVKLFPPLQPFFAQDFFSNSQSQHFNLWKRVACVWPLGKGMMGTPVPQGLDQPLQQGDDEWWPGKTLTTNSPSWMWKMNRKHLAKGDDKNKAGKKLGKGTTSNIRKLQRLHLQDKQPEENSWERGGWENSWERGEWQDSWERGEWEDSWERDGWTSGGGWGNSWERDEWGSSSWKDAWDEGEEEEEKEERGGRKRRPPTPPAPKQRGKSRNSSRSSSRSSRGSDTSMASSSSRGAFYRIPRPKVRKEWRKKEEERQAWHDSCNQKSKELGKIHEEKEKEEEPLVKGKDKAKEEELLVKGTTIAGKEHQLHLQETMKRPHLWKRARSWLITIGPWKSMKWSHLKTGQPWMYSWKRVMTLWFAPGAFPKEEQRCLPLLKKRIGLPR